MARGWSVPVASGTDAHIGALGTILETVSGVVFERPGHKRVYVAGDTVWRPEVEAAIRQHDPDLIVINTGYARIPSLDSSIIMGKEDLSRARRLAPEAVVIGVHMESVNHAGQTRQELREFIAKQQLDANRTRVPDDGEPSRF
ncbi:hypothetical protein [uncultured Luteimonas sp.]|uniref:MBL fold metallo-hydrolase n=1 Tax=uncultured Luteimonas sp. TaxID=453144 RepID=UPI00261D516F|nr:hypothetical protein [uncultured Luteimonas sp.]